MATYPNLDEVMPERGEEPDMVYSSDNDSTDSENFDDVELDGFEYDEYGELIPTKDTPPPAYGTTHSGPSAPPTPATTPVVQPNKAKKPLERRQLTLRRNSKGKLGIKLRRMGKCVYFSFVEKGSPAAQAGLGFGDQLCEMNNINVAHSTGRSIMKAIRRSNATEFPMIVRHRPYDVDIDGTIIKDRDLVCKTKGGIQLGPFKLTNVLKKGNLKHLHILAVGNDVVLGRSNLELAEALKKHSPQMTLRVMPKVFCDHLLKRQDKEHVRALMQLSNPPS